MRNSQQVPPQKHRTAVRYLIPIVALLAVVAGLAGVKFGQISGLIKAGKAMAQSGPPPESVGTTVAQTQTWEGTLSAVGSIAAAKGVELSNDAPGVVSRIALESGAMVKQGQVLLELDSRVERAQMASARSRLDLASLTAGRSRSLFKTSTISQSQVDADEAALKTATTDLTALQAQIDRKTVRAPFSGRLGIRLVNLGQYLNPGTPIAVLEAIESVYVDFTVPQQRLPDIKVGTPVRVAIEGLAGVVQDGVVAAIDPAIDSTTRTIKVRASVPNKDEKLRPGMFANVTVVLPQHGSVVAVPAMAVVHAPYGDSLFVVEDKKDDAGTTSTGADGKPVKVARQQFARVGDVRGDYVAILDGITAGQEVVTAGAFKLRNGSRVAVKDDVKLAPELSPHPENR